MRTCFRDVPIAEIYEGQLILHLCLFEAEIEFEVVEPWDFGAEVFPDEFLGQVFVVVAQELGVGGVVEGNEDGVVGDTDVAVQSVEEGVGEVGGIPCF